MATIQSFPVRQQQIRRWMSKINWNNFYAHFELRPHLNRVFSWSNKLIRTYGVIFMICIHFNFWLPIMVGDPTDITELPFTESNNSMTMKQLREWAFVKRCTLLPSVSIGSLSSYTSMHLLILILSKFSYLLMLPLQWSCFEFSYHQALNPYRWFCWCRKILIYLVISSICTQLISVFGCRPIEIIYDIRYTSMFIVQIIGFFICLLFAFFLGVKYASVKRGN